MHGGLRVRASIIDFRSDTPSSEDSFLVDTNAWYWLGYDRASLSPRPPNAEVISHYTSYIKVARTNGANLYWCGLQFAELAHVIEKVEREIYQSKLGDGQKLSTKRFRQYPSQRRRVVEQITAVWDTVKSIGRSLPLNTTNETVESAITTIRSAELDGYDLFLVEAMRQNGINKIITDDSDYASVRGLQVFTVNERILAEAKNADKPTRR